MIEQKIIYYLERYTAGVITSEERMALQELMCDPNHDEVFQRILDAEWPHIEKNDLEFSVGVARLQNAVTEAVKADILNEIQVSGKLHSVHSGQFIRRWWWAAAILIIGTTIGIAVSSDRQTNALKKSIASSFGDIAPGSNKAILTLSNGEQVELDSAAATTIQDGNLTIQNKNGELKYINKSGDATMNTMRTPNGGQYQLVLADGTKVWLNAASSITYPTAFDGTDRRIKISGEAYLEVAKDKTRPFLVDVAGESIVEVLGTSFNINSYGNEGAIKTTLVDGSVRVNNEVVLMPGQQALLSVHSTTAATGKTNADTNTQIATAQKIVVLTADVQQIIAWKNGLFSFNNADLRSVMRQLERWYDIKVMYEGKNPSITISGEMFRNVTLSDVLAFLEASGLKFKMEGKELIIF